MYRDDFLANAIYERARDWTRASFFLARVEPGPNACEVHFTNGVVMRNLEAALVGASRGQDLCLLFCDVEPGQKWPHEAWVLLYHPHGQPGVVGWTYVTGDLDATKSKISLTNHTEGLQLQLNRLRMRETIMMRGLARNTRTTVPLFAPDHSEIAKMTGVPESTVRGFFDGRATKTEAREKILLAFNIRPEELETDLWES